MKKLLLLFATLMIIASSADLTGQVLSESAKRKVTVGVDVFADIWMVTNQEPFIPVGFSTRTINQGATGFIMYNFEIGESLNSFSAGLAIRAHNMYSNSIITDIKADTIKFEKIPDNVDYRKSKINPVYLDLPIEFKFRTEKGFKLGVGLKAGYLIDSKEKYKGNRPGDGQNVLTKTKDLYQMETFVFGATLRIGYKWVSAFGYYQFTKIFRQGRGPEIYPISVGITITPF